MKAKLTPAVERFLRVAREVGEECGDAGMVQSAAELEADYRDGRVHVAPWRWDQCRSWLDAWLYIYRRARLGDGVHMQHDGEVARFVVWVGHEVSDKMVDWLERVHGALGVCKGLTHLRLVDTCVTHNGLTRLRRLFPDVSIQSFSEAELEADSMLMYPPGRYES